MAARAQIDGRNEERRRPPVRRDGLLQLGWPHFVLFGGILGGLLSLAIAIIFAALTFH